VARLGDARLFLLSLAECVGGPSAREERCRSEGRFRYKLHPAGGDLGTATYPAMIRPGEEILYLDGRSFRVLGVRMEDKDSPFIGQLEVEGVSDPASRQ
jgi:hypothetical protein